jgi:uncharacterized protein YggE
VDDQSKNVEHLRRIGIVVTGTSRIRARPDKATVDTGVLTRGQNGQAAMTANNVSTAPEQPEV